VALCRKNYALLSHLYKKNENEMFTHIALLSFCQRKLEFTKVIMLSDAANPTVTNITVVSKSNNIIFTLIY